MKQILSINEDYTVSGSIISADSILYISLPTTVLTTKDSVISINSESTTIVDNSTVSFPITEGVESLKIQIQHITNKHTTNKTIVVSLTVYDESFTMYMFNQLNDLYDQIKELNTYNESLTTRIKDLEVALES